MSALKMLLRDPPRNMTIESFRTTEQVDLGKGIGIKGPVSHLFFFKDQIQVSGLSFSKVFPDTKKSNSLKLAMLNLENSQKCKPT